MARLTCLNTVFQWIDEQTTQYSGIYIFINKLKSMIENKPENGLYDPILSGTGKTIPCRKQSVNLSLFSCRHAIGYDHITATYIYNETSVLIVKMNYS